MGIENPKRPNAPAVALAVADPADGPLARALCIPRRITVDDRERGRGAEAEAHAIPRIPRLKRGFDLVFCVLTIPAWLPLMVGGLLAVLVGSGFPVLYVSRRLVYRGQTARIAKLRTMVPGAAAIANRGTVPFNGRRFLNIGLGSPLYTAVGRWIERFCMTELPQFFHVWSGTMSVIGNRPLPVDVMKALVEVYPDAADRFLTRAGLTGPAQLVGRYTLADADRLAIEIAYCRHCRDRYTVYLDLMIALHTGLVLARIRRPLTVKEVTRRMETWARPRSRTRRSRDASSRIGSGDGRRRRDARARRRERASPRSTS